jgi:preprotein translocase SecF subunit
MKWLDNLKSDDVHITRYGKRFIIPSAAIFLVGVILFIILGFNLGLDFTGGTIVSVNAANTDEAVVKSVMDAQGVTYSVVLQKGTDGTDIYAIKFNADTQKTNEIITVLENGFDVLESQAIGAAARDETIITVFTAILLALLGILIYMLFRFKFTSGIATLLALAHDVLLMSALVVIFRVQINASFIAALITIVGYSINNSLVIFDRVREFEKHNSDNLALEDILDKSVKITLGRTMITMITTIVPVIILTAVSIVMRLTSLTEFALPIIFGLLSGTYSSLFLIAPMYCRFEGARLAKQRRKALAAKA